MLTAVGWTYTVAFNGKTTAINLNTATNTTHQFEACEKTMRAFQVYEMIDYLQGFVTDKVSLQKHCLALVVWYIDSRSTQLLALDQIIKVKKIFISFY